MSALAAIVREVIGLFVDGWLAAAIIAVVALAGVAAALNVSSAAGAILLVGCLGVLVTNVLAAVRR